MSMGNMEKVQMELKRFRRNQTVILLSIIFVNFAVIAGVVGYFSAKEKALCGSIYLDSETMGINAVSHFLNLDISSSNIEAGLSAMQQSGYGSGGFLYASRINGEVYAFAVLTIIMVTLLGVGLYNCYRIGRKALYVQVEEIINDNNDLKVRIDNERKYNEKQYKKMQDFTENIAHQIKTPLSVIAMKLDMLKEWLVEITGESMSVDDVDNISAFKEKCKHYEEMIDICTKNTFKIKAFIKDLLDISRIESGKVILADDEIEIDSMLTESINNCTVDAKNVVTNFNDDRIHIFADEGWLIEAFVNILDNCGSYIKDIDGGRVYVDVIGKNDSCEITVSDNGDGISIENYNNIFSRFETGGGQGDFRFGIGLNLSKLIIEAHNGRIKAGNSEEHGGAEFKVILPIYKLKSKWGKTLS
ncbi:MAG: HAMP domain-containing sensor histidine kinase [Eubacteriales bacterium]|nr:HAMP domain-containing sensor histidine kinase [Eubacteriales bacterium]